MTCSASLAGFGGVPGDGVGEVAHTPGEGGAGEIAGCFKDREVTLRLGERARGPFGTGGRRQIDAESEQAGSSR